jgi:membrane protease subunit (stomatin/prohibitin family)
MGLLDSFKNEFIDIIDWTDSTNDTLIYKFPRFQNEIKMGAKLTVRESQQAVFLNEGTIADVYQPGLYTLHTENMPILTTLKGWKYGFNSPFKADVFFVSTKQFINQRWGTQSPVTINDERFGMIDIRAFGTFSFRIVDAGKFIKELAGTDGEYTTDDVDDQLRSMMVSKFTSAAGSGNITIDKFAANLDELSQLCQDKLNADFDAYGLKITKFIVENVSMPDDVKKEIFDYSRLNKLNMDQLAQFRTTQSIETAAGNTGMGGMGVGMGVGMGMGKIFGKTFNEAQNTQTPPPLPAQFFVAVNGQQTGPFSMEDISKMAQGGRLTRESLVWKAGMAAWAAAGTVGDLNQVFSTIPPPIG